MSKWRLSAGVLALLFLIAPDMASASVKVFPPDGDCEPGTILAWQGNQENVKCVDLVTILNQACPAGCIQSVTESGEWKCAAPAPKCLKTKKIVVEGKYETTCGRFSGGGSFDSDVCLSTSVAKGNSGGKANSQFYDQGSVQLGDKTGVGKSEKEVCAQYETVTITCP